MPAPTKPDIDYSYTGFQQEAQLDTFPGTQLDNDLAELKRAADDGRRWRYLHRSGKVGNHIGCRISNMEC